MKFIDYMPEEFAEEIDPKEISSRPVGIISITDPGRQASLKPGWADMLRLQFNDVDPEYLEGLGDDAKGKVLFNEQHAKKIVNWVNKNKGQLYGVIVHCWAGISRSGAVAKFIADKFGLPFRKEQAEFVNHYIYDLLQQADRGASSPKHVKVDGHLYQRV